jgi:hypothetical protein
MSTMKRGVHTVGGRLGIYSIYTIANLLCDMWITSMMIGIIAIVICV